MDRVYRGRLKCSGIGEGDSIGRELEPRSRCSATVYLAGSPMWLHRVMQESCDGRVRNERNCFTLNARRSHRVGSHLKRKRKRKLNDVDAGCLRYHRR